MGELVESRDRDGRVEGRVGRGGGVDIGVSDGVGVCGGVGVSW